MVEYEVIWVINKRIYRTWSLYLNTKIVNLAYDRYISQFKVLNLIKSAWRCKLWINQGQVASNLSYLRAAAPAQRYKLY